jgi:hypothetical protein
VREIERLGFGHEAAGMLDEIAQQRQGLGPQGEPLVALPQAALRVIQMEWPKREMVLLFHQVSCITI